MKDEQGRDPSGGHSLSSRPALAIDAQALSLRYPDGTLALMPADIRIPEGTLAFLTGASGSGKTSLLRLFMGMVQPTDGHLLVMGQQMNRAKPGEIRRLRQTIGPVFQDFRLVPGRTALENVMAGSRFLRSGSRHLRQEALEALARVGLPGKSHAYVERLSWGERQRVSIARAVVRGPGLILADEPTGNLDKENALLILSLLASFRDRQTTVVITTHATHLIADVHPDLIARLDAGVLVDTQVVDPGREGSTNREGKHGTTP